MNGGSTWQTSNSFSSLSVGTYSIRVKDGSSCLSSTSSVTLSKSAPSATFNANSVSCAGGSDGGILVSNPTGANGGGVAQNYEVRLNTGSWIGFSSTSYSYTNLSSGTYTVHLRDQLGCTESYSVVVSQPTANTVLITGFVAGANGSITVTSGGGTWNKTYRLYRDTTSPYTVGGGTLVATISNVTSGNPSQTFTGLAEGYYYVIVTDANGCTESSLIQSTFNEDPKGGGMIADISIRDCITDQIYYASSIEICQDGNLSLNPFEINVGDYVQYAYGTDCPHEATYCGRVSETGLGVDATAIITNQDLMDGCEDLRCFQ
jgi:hypothetical protein